MKKLRRMENGTTYTIIYLKMQLASLRNNGILAFDHVEDSFANELAYELDEAPEDVAATIDFLLRHKLLVPLSEDESYLPEAVENSGSEGSSAKRVREFRERQALQCNDDALHCHGEKSREEKIREEGEKSREESKADKPPARFPPTEEMVRAYIAEHDYAVDAAAFVDYYTANGWVQGKGKPIKDWKAAVRTWARREKKPENKAPEGVDLVQLENGDYAWKEQS